MKRRVVVIVWVLLNLMGPMWAQQGGDATYDFLNLTNSARIGAMGGNQVGINDGDLNLVFHNPAALNDTLHQFATFNYVPYMADIQYGYAAYARHFENIGTFSVGVHNINYGYFDRADEYGVINGSFSAAEYAINLSYARELTPRLQAGMSIKPIVSNFEKYKSFGLAADLGVMYSSYNKLFAMGLVLKNVGSQLSAYNATYEPLPTDLQFGVSTKLAHAPFRFSLTAQHLLQFDLRYNLPDDEGNMGVVNRLNDNPSFGDNLMRHMVFGLEFIPTKSFYVAAGYNHRRRKELAVDAKASTVGFSWGFGFRIYKFQFAYGSARFHLAGSSNHFSISTNLSAF
jgi:hypothetical protein